ncbi:ribosomal protein [Aneurinibacillus sp. XH2]|uniref:ribosomal-processing cysteine protease Prp n=1 Tax=Aneurinibacillus sp. XH2 TaxID=1450761 RepID=UPI00070EE6D6|nr:ribosomal-processing cysteine protease Prp [Aneurinibacillus sp. XH2]AMA72768.1 ribosomal protein [Aneurinibacillus sp. XH2]
MIHITAEMANGQMKVEAVGHANYAEHGKDIVCAAVSAIMQTALLGLQAIAEQYPEHVSLKVTEKKGERKDEEILDV